MITRIVRPLRWLVRFRHRKGYGIHSPFAFNFVTGVVYESGAYYAYDQLKAQYKAHRPQTLRLKDGKLLFRVANFAAPKSIVLVGYAQQSWVAQCLAAACGHARLVEAQGTTPTAADFVLLAPNTTATQAEAFFDALPVGGTLMLTHTTGRNRAVWQRLQAHPKATVTFNLADFGIVFYRPQLNRQAYIINYY